MKKLCALALALFVSGGAFAFSQNRTVSGNVTTFAATAVNASNVGSVAISFASTGQALVTMPGAVGVGGSTIPVSVVNTVDKVAVGAALGRFALKAIGVLSVGVAIYDLYKELGVTLQRNPDGTVAAVQPNPDQCTASPCYEYKATGTGAAVPYTPTHAAACAYMSTVYTNTANDTYSFSVNYSRGAALSPPIVYCEIKDANKNTGTGVVTTTTIGFADLTKRINSSIQPTTGTLVELSQSQLADMVAARSGWPQTSALGRALTDSIANGETVTPSPTTVSGPATVPGEKTVTTNTTSNTTTTNQSTINNTYSGPNVTTTVTNTSVTVNNSDGTTTNSQSSTVTPAVTSPAADAPEVKVCGLPNTPACKIDETGTPTAADVKKDPQKQVDDLYQPLKDFASNPVSKLPTLPTINWAFRLPSGCVPLSLPAFAPYLQNIDICPFTSMFHDIMSIVWVMGGLFGAISTFWRNVFSQN